MRRLIITTIFFLLLSGCAANRELGAVPTEVNDFKLPVISLMTNYPEIEVYNRDNLFLGYCTPINQLSKLWGEPDEIKTIWLQVPAMVLPFVFAGSGGVIAVGIGYGMYPAQPQHYIWRKGNYEIDAYVRTEIGCGYEPRLWFWEWKQSANPYKSLETDLLRRS